jgi:hypothetical protein
LPRGVLAAQTIHAAGETASPLPPGGTHAIALAAKNEQHLLKIARKLQKRSVPHKIIREPDKPWLNQAMAIGLYPIKDRKQLRRALSNLPLLTERKRDDNE